MKPAEEGPQRPNVTTKRELVQRVFDNPDGEALLLMLMDEAGMTRYNSRPLSEDSWVRRDERQRLIHTILSLLAKEPEQLKADILQRYQDKLNNQYE